jgi:transposase InsO family protein
MPNEVTVVEANVVVRELQAGYVADSWFADARNVADLQLRSGLYFQRDGRVCVPEFKDLRQRIIREAHDLPISGHFGHVKTLELMRRDFWWPRMAAEVEHWCKSCLSCQRNKSDGRTPAGLMQPLGVPEYRWQSVTMDFITQLPKTANGYDAIYAVVDRMSKMVHLVACHSTVTAEQTARMFINSVFKLHGLPGHVVSDRGPQFVSHFWNELMGRLSVEVRLSSGGHPQTDGQTERVNRTLEQYLRHFTSANQDDWDEYLAPAEYAMNNAYHESIRTTPFMLNFGQHPRTPFTAPFSKLKEWYGKVPAVQPWVGRMQDALKVAKDALERAQQRQKDYADKSRSEQSYAVGDEVMLSTKTINIKKPANGSRKFCPCFIGPFKVIQKVGTPGHEVAYKLDLPKSMSRYHPVFHVSLLRPYNRAGRMQPVPPPIEVDGDILYEFEDILGDRKSGRRQWYLVKWKNYGHEHNSWEPESSFEYVAAELDAYWQRVKRRGQNPTPVLIPVSTPGLSAAVPARTDGNDAEPTRRGSGRGGRPSRQRRNPDGGGGQRERQGMQTRHS